jgi:NAD(P)-dependent dehydrogenase (short-subunit alcohol dehydrogenase family)
VTDVHSENLDAAIDDDGATITRDHFKPGDLCVVTGCARGFGRAISRRLAREGAKLAIWDLLDDEGEQTAEMCRQAGAEVAYFHCDMSDPENIASAAAAVIERFGPAYAVVNNAGINLRTPAIDHPVEMWNKTLAVNLVGSFLCSQAFAREMIKTGRGAIINFASGRAIEGAVNSIAYAASKAGIIAMTKTLASEWATHGIRANAIVPGVSETRANAANPSPWGASATPTISPVWWSCCCPRTPPISPASPSPSTAGASCCPRAFSDQIESI